MIQPISMATNMMNSVAPVSFSARNQMNNETKALNTFVSSSRELSPSVKNSQVAQKLDFYA